MKLNLIFPLCICQFFYSVDSAPTETRSVDSLSERDRGYSSDEDRDFDDRRSYDDRRYRDEYSVDSRDYSVSDYDRDRRPIMHRDSRLYRAPEPEPFYNTGYRPPSYAPSWDSYGKDLSPSRQENKVKVTALWLHDGQLACSNLVNFVLISLHGPLLILSFRCHCFDDLLMVVPGDKIL